MPIDKSRKYWYHATKSVNVESIVNNGLYPGEDGLVYMADTPGGANAFMVVRNFDASPITILKIDTSTLDDDLKNEGFDHSPSFFAGIEVMTYSGEISPDCIGVRAIQVFHNEDVKEVFIK